MNSEGAVDKAYQNAIKQSDEQNARIEHDKALERVIFICYIPCRHGKIISLKRGCITTTSSIKDNLMVQLDKLPYDLQLRVLDFAKALIPKGVEGKSLLRFEGAIRADDLQLMAKAIEEGCEKVDIGEW